MRKLSRALIVIAWLSITATLTWATRYILLDVTGTEEIASGVAGLLALLALVAGVPYLRIPRERTVVRVRFSSKEERRFTGDILRVRKETRLRPRFGFFRLLALTLAFGIVAGDVIAYVMKEMVLAALPADRAALLDYDPTIATRVYSEDGETVCEFTLQKRIKVPLSKVPEHVRNAFVAAEDKTFYRHEGIDPVAMARAFLANKVNGKTIQGASTITQQAVKQIVLRNAERTYHRKIEEVLIAVEIERRLTKDQILEAYLNHVFLGRGAYGIEAASKIYFGKSVAGLSLGEAAMLAGLPKAPSADSPVTHGKKARARQAYVLGRMAKDGYASRDSVEKAKRAPIPLVVNEAALNLITAPAFCDLAWRELKRLYGNQKVFNEGLTVQSTINMKMQRAAEAAVRSGLLDLERRIGWNGPEGHDDAYAGCNGGSASVPDGRVEMARIAAVTGGGFAVCIRGKLIPVHPDDASRMRSWENGAKRKVTVGDKLSVMVRTMPTTGERSKLSATGRVLKRPEAIPGAVTRFAVTAQRFEGAAHPEALQSSMIAVEPSSGELRVYVGGFDANTKFNIPIMARRQPGSSIKPVIYLEGLSHGMTAADKVVDRKICYKSASGKWCPENYKGPDSGKQYLGEVRLDKALAMSLNSISVQIIAKYGVDEAIGIMRKLGYASPIQRVLPIAIGSLDITLWEHTMAYAQIAANGALAPSHPGWDMTALEYAAAHVDDDKRPAPAENMPRRGVFFTKITDRRGRTLLSIPRTSPSSREQAVESADAYALLHLMKGVVQEGTGKRALSLGRPIAAKTGTTNSFRDTWFMGCTADLCTGTWVGRMSPKPIVEEATGGAVALPIWLAFMTAAHPAVQARDFPIPSDVVMMPTENGGLMPYQHDRLPEKLLSGVTRENGSSRAPF